MSFVSFFFLSFFSPVVDETTVGEALESERWGTLLAQRGWRCLLGIVARPGRSQSLSLFSPQKNFCTWLVVRSFGYGARSFPFNLFRFIFEILFPFFPHFSSKISLYTKERKREKKGESERRYAGKAAQHVDTIGWHQMASTKKRRKKCLKRVCVCVSSPAHKWPVFQSGAGGGSSARRECRLADRLAR